MAIPVRPLEPGDQPLVTRGLERHPLFISELTFTSLFTWGDTFPIWVGEIGESLILLNQGPDDPVGQRWFYGPPLGPVSPASLLEQFPEVAGFRWIPEETAAALREAGCTVAEAPDHFDYVYRVTDLAELPGAKYHNKRNLIDHCLREHTCQYEPITLKNREECIRMLDEWCAARNCRETPGLCGEYLALHRAFRHYDALPLIGGAVRVDGPIRAFAIGEALGPGMAVCHFEKAMPAFHGLGQVINQWFAIHSLKGFEWVNREQDLGIPGLRQAKQSYHPARMIRKFIATRPG
jgi:hypothetical protein